MRFFSIFVLSIALLFSGISFSHWACQTLKWNWTTWIKNFIEECSSDTTGIKVWDAKDWQEHQQFQRKVVKIVEGALGFAALFAIAAMVVSGILYTTAYGNDERLRKAKTTAIFAWVGLLVTLLSFPFVNAIVGFVYNIWSK